MIYEIQIWSVECYQTWINKHEIMMFNSFFLSLVIVTKDNNDTPYIIIWAWIWRVNIFIATLEHFNNKKIKTNRPCQL